MTDRTHGTHRSPSEVEAMPGAGILQQLAMMFDVLWSSPCGRCPGDSNIEPQVTTS